jgi:transposase
MRDVVDGIRYLTHNGPVWRALPADFPPAWTIRTIPCSTGLLRSPHRETCTKYG